MGSLWLAVFSVYLRPGLLLSVKTAHDADQLWSTVSFWAIRPMSCY
jgi:hypothetical protein